VSTRSFRGMVLAVLCVWGIAMVARADEKKNTVQAFVGSVQHWFNGWFRVRATGDEKFGEANRKVGYECLYDHRTGNVLYLLTEGGAVAAAPAPNNFGWKTLGTGNATYVVKFHTRDGRIWGWHGAKWMLIADPQPEPALYDVQLVHAENDTVRILRLDLINGNSRILETADKGATWKVLPGS
jgi:hypothetical protein